MWRVERDLFRRLEEVLFYFPCSSPVLDGALLTARLSFLDDSARQLAVRPHESHILAARESMNEEMGEGIGDVRSQS
jgi:hypothetical protein